MHKAILMLLLAAASNSALAEWRRIGSNADATGTYYVDPVTIRKVGGKATMSVLHDFKTVRTVGDVSFMSRKIQYEYDCTEAQFRGLSLIEYSANMGNGDVVLSNSDPRKWEPVVPESVAESSWKIACGKRKL